MTATVRLFTLSSAGLDVPLPYLGRDLLTCTGTEADSSEPAAAGQYTKAVYVQVEPGKRVHAELTPEGHEPRVADTGSPILEGHVQLPFGPGWTLSVLEAE